MPVTIPSTYSPTMIRPPLRGKKVALHCGDIVPECSQILTNDRSDEGGYIASGMAYRIPEGVNRIRFFVYWDDEEFTDVDLHARGTRRDGTEFHVGWNSDPHAYGVVHSGDITHSDAAEYIDIDMDAQLLRAQTRIHIFNGKESFKEIDTCYVGMMAVKKLGAKVKLYDPKNCFFTHELKSDSEELQYGYVDVPGRRLYFVGKEPEILPEYCRPFEAVQQDRLGGHRLTMDKYLSMLFEAQEVTTVTSPEEADLVLTMEKSAEEKGVSLVDRNFYLDG